MIIKIEYEYDQPQTETFRCWARALDENGKILAGAYGSTFSEARRAVIEKVKGRQGPVPPAEEVEI